MNESFKPSFTVDSKKRVNKETTNSSNFTYVLNIDDTNYDSVTINSAQIPKTYYTLSTGVKGSDDLDDNQFKYSEDGGLNYRTITVTPGYYNIYSFAKTLVPLLEAASVAAGGNFKFHIEYPDRLTEVDTGKYTYKVYNNGGVQPQFKMGDNRIRRMMGLGCYNAVTGAEEDCVFSGDQLVSDEIVNMQWTDHLVIKSNIALNRGNIQQDSAVLAVIPVTTVPDDSMIIFNSPGLDLDSRELANNGGDLFQFSLYDDQDRLIDLNGSDWFLQIQLFRRNKYYEIATKKLQIEMLEEK